MINIQDLFAESGKYENSKRIKRSSRRDVEDVYEAVSDEHELISSDEENGFDVGGHSKSSRRSSGRKKRESEMETSSGLLPSGVKRRVYLEQGDQIEAEDRTSSRKSERENRDQKHSKRDPEGSASENRKDKERSRSKERDSSRSKREQREKSETKEDSVVDKRKMRHLKAMSFLATKTLEIFFFSATIPTFLHLAIFLATMNLSTSKRVRQIWWKRLRGHKC